jgi:hypothetical protein
MTNPEFISRLRRIWGVTIVLALLLWGIGLAAPAFVPPANAADQEAVEDAHLRKKFPNKNTGGEAALAVRGVNNDETWAIMKFTNVPAGDATLSIFVNTPRSGTLSLFDAPATPTWAEATVTWNNKPLPVGALQETKPNVAGLVTFNVGTLTAGTHSFYLQASNGSAITFVASSEHATNPGPTLSTAGPPPTTTTVAPTTTTQPPPTTTTTPPTTTTTPPEICLLTSNYASDQAAIDDAGGPDGDPMCVTVDTYRTLTSPLNLRTGVTVQCLDPTKGFTGSDSTGAWVLVLIPNITDASFTGCKLESTGPTQAAAGGIGFGSGPISRVRLVDLDIRNTEWGISSGATISGTGFGDTEFGLRVLLTEIRFTYATGIGFYPNANPPTNTARYVELNGNLVIGNQRSGNAGQAGIQTGGIPPESEANVHSQFRLLNNTVDNSPAAVGTPTGCPAGDLVDIGLDQADNFLIEGNLVRHCYHGGEGIVVVGPNNTIRTNTVHDAGAGAFTLISYSSVPQQTKNILFENNFADGPLDVTPNWPGGGQGLALSFGANSEPMEGVTIRNFRAVNHQSGIQSYIYQDDPHGSGNTIVDSNNPVSPTNPWCQGLSLFGAGAWTITNTPNCSA